MTPQPQSHHAGFTLLEMLVVLALLSLLMAVLTSTIYLGIIARARVTAAARDQQDFVAFDRILVQKLSHTYPAWVVNPQAGPQSDGIDFTGAKQSISFLGPALDSEGAGLAHYTVSLAQQNGRPALLLQSTLATRPPGPLRAAYFAAGLASLKINYFGPPQNGSVALWQSQWIMRSTPPALIAIQVSFPPGDRRVWPVIIIHPQIDGDITCQIDPSTHRCVGR